MALVVLNRLKARDAIDGFCRVWVETRHKDLTAILEEAALCGYGTEVAGVSRR